MGWETYEKAMERYRGWDESLESFPKYDEVIMWFEHDLFDQLILIHHLDFFARQNLGQTRLSLICIGEYPDVEPFHGLGQLNPDQLASLLVTRQEVTSQQLELGRSAWRAFTSSDPTELEQLFHSDTSALPFLSGALQRFLEEYPSTQNGLPRTERQILSVLASGPKSPGDLFLAATYPFEERVFMGDSTFWARVKGLKSGPHPLVEWDVIESRPVPKGEVRITDAGRAVLEGRADWIELDGVDRWLGGVRLQRREAAWRWDQQAAKLRPGK
jgi:hypothetical protein